MFPNARFVNPAINQGLHRQQGVGLPMAIFIITVLSLLVAMVVSTQSTGSMRLVNQIQSTKALYAAESGVQMALNKYLPPAAASTPSCSPVSKRVEFPAAGALSGCYADITCAAYPATGQTFLQVKSVGVCGQGIDQGRRVLEVMVK